MNSADVDAIWVTALEVTRDTNEPPYRVFANLVAAAEREACAETASCFVNGGQEIAAAIRARGEV